MSTKYLFKNLTYNITGYILPITAGLISTPILLDKLGGEKFGVLSIIWMIASYFTLFDFGFGRALAQQVAEKIHNSTHATISKLFQDAHLFMFILSIFGTFLFILLSYPLTYYWLHTSKQLQSDIFYSFIITSLSIPLMILSNGMNGFLMGLNNFFSLNIIKTSLLTINLISSVFLVLFFSKNNHILSYICLTSGLIRLTALLIQFQYCRAVFPLSWHPITYTTWKPPKELTLLGGWISISNITSPIMDYFDRIFISHIINPMAVSIYVIPFEIINKLLIISHSIASPLSTAFANPQLSLKSLKENIIASIAIIVIVFSIITIISVKFYPVFFQWWLGNNYQKEMVEIAFTLTAGVFFNSLGIIPFVYIQSIGHAKLTAKIHLAELPIYLLTLLTLIINFGVLGSAFAWALRTFIDAVLLSIVAYKLTMKRYYTFNHNKNGKSHELS